MFNSIRGEITQKNAGIIYMMTGGIEWEIHMPGHDISALPDSGAKTVVFTWLCHREDSMTLFGFANEERRETFLELLKVEGIGPKGALKILSGITQRDLETALEAGDITRLEAVPGLGKKTAQKMILALKGKIVQSTDKKEPPASRYNDLAGALVEMGYEKRAAISALDRAASEIAEATPEAEKEALLFRKAILYLSGS